MPSCPLLRPSAAFVAALAFACPLGAWAQDTDGDGTPDASDARPADPTVSALGFAPAQDRYGSIMFEDNWPAQGDLDFNDVALAYNVQVGLTADGRATAVFVSLWPQAIGGVLRHGLGLHLPVPAAQLGRATRSVNGGAPTLLPVLPDAELTVELSSNLGELFGGAAGPLNVRPTQAYQVGARIDVEIRFATPVSLSAGPAPYDLFIFRSTDSTHEIHRPEFTGSSRMNGALFGTANDGSGAGRFFVDTAGLPFALIVPEGASYPGEEVQISSLYPRIVSFAASGGVLDADFYTTPNPASAYRDVNGQAPPPAPAPSTSPGVVCTPPASASACVALTDNGQPTCASTPRPATTPCDDGDPLTASDTCDGAGRCVGVPASCPPDTACLTYVGAACTPTPVAAATACDDGDPLTVGDACDGAGQCVGVTCPANTACLTYVGPTCAPTPVAATTACDDGDPLTVGDACDGAGQCAGVPVSCPADTACLTYVGAACTPTPVADGTTCDDSDACTTGDACAAGICVAGAASTCANGTCSNTSGQATCSCPSGFTGGCCQVPVDACAGAPCGPRSTCTNTPGTPTGRSCTCLPGYTSPDGSDCGRISSSKVMPVALVLDPSFVARYGDRAEARAEAGFNAARDRMETMTLQEPGVGLQRVSMELTLIASRNLPLAGRTCDTASPLLAPTRRIASGDPAFSACCGLAPTAACTTQDPVCVASAPPGVNFAAPGCFPQSVTAERTLANGLLRRVSIASTTPRSTAPNEVSGPELLADLQAFLLQQDAAITTIVSREPVLYILLTADSFAEGEGLSFTNSVCSQTTKAASAVDHAGSSPDELGALIAHQVGHAFGLSHDSASSFIMSPSFGTPPPTQFSTFSQTLFDVWWTSYFMGTSTFPRCLDSSNRGLYAGSPACGNGRLDANEQCDPGLWINDPTCDQNLCQLSAGAACASTDACCTNGQIANAGTPCRASAGVCDVAETCDGVNATCPLDAALATGTTCPGGACSLGACLPDFDGLCNAAFGTNQCASIPSTCGQVLCPVAPGSSSCFILPTPPADGTPCGSGSVCSAGSCVPASQARTYRWEVGTWSTCNATTGTRTRPVACRDETGASAAASLCTSAAPAAIELCGSPVLICQGP